MVVKLDVQSLSRQSGISCSRIREYLHLGLIQPRYRTVEAVLERIEMLEVLRRRGMPTNAIVRLTLLPGSGQAMAVGPGA